VPEAPPVTPPLAAPAVPAPVPAPVVSIVGPPIRIALTTSAAEVRISAGELELVERRAEAPRERLRGDLRIRLEHPEGEGSDLFRVQVAALASSARAEELARMLTERFNLPAQTRQSSTGSPVAVRVGAFTSREEAERFAAGTVRPAGYPDAVVVREAGAGSIGEPRLVLRGPGDVLRLSRAGFVLAASAPGDPLRFDGKPYRGVLEVLPGRNNRLTVVNQLGLEEYLCGVVPAEIPPTIYPEAAALAAQAVAARTYALRNMGRFRADGFDLTSDERTQVYGGMGIEKPATNQAVRDTAGIAIYYDGSPIEAMYSSTCGGRTEDFASVFDRPAVPYLTSIVCAVESAESGAPSPVAAIEGSHDLTATIMGSDGAAANRNLELARVLGLGGTEAWTIEFLEGAAGTAELRTWVGRARRLAPKLATEEPAGPALATRAGFIQFAAESLFGPAEMASRISAADARYYVENLADGGSVDPAARRALAYLMQRGLWVAGPDNLVRPDAAVRRADALAWLAVWSEAASGETLRTAAFERVDEGKLLVRGAGRTFTIPLRNAVRLFRRDGPRSTAVGSLQLVGSEKLRFHVDGGGAIDFLEVELNPAGVASDRVSPQSTWETTLARRAAADKLRALAPTIGELVALAPARLGASGRAVQIRLEGSRGSVVLNGYRVRLALGLKDTLFVLSRTRGADGAIESFTFRGRGWGHGVGLCQVGAVGMARAGKSYEEILKTYYRGVELRKAY
jgi:stage II sporulation protein D